MCIHFDIKSRLATLYMTIAEAPQAQIRWKYFKADCDREKIPAIFEHC